MKCCDRELATPYCPLCGKPVNCLVSLLAHVRHNQHQAEIRTIGSGWPQIARERAKAHDKWKSWGDALEKVIANRTATQDR